MIKNRIRLAVAGAVVAGLAVTAGQAQAATPATDQGNPTIAGVTACQDFPRMIGVNKARAYEGTGAGDTPFTFTVSTWGCGHAATIGWDFKSTGDFFTPGGQFSWNEGDMTPRTFSVNVHKDALDEPNDDFWVDFIKWSGWTDIDSAAKGTILDDDGPVKWNVDDVSCSEGDPVNGSTKPCTFSVSRSAPVPQGIETVKFSTANGTAVAGKDYVVQSNTPISMWVGDQKAFGKVHLSTNDLCTTDRNLKVNLSSPPAGSVLADPEAIMTIVEDDFWCDVD